MKLTDAAIKKAKPKTKPYKMADGGGLFLLHELHEQRLAQVHSSPPEVSISGSYSNRNVGKLISNRHQNKLQSRNVPILPTSSVLLDNGFAIGGGLADVHFSPRVIGCWFVPLAVFCATLCDRFFYPRID